MARQDEERRPPHRRHRRKAAAGPWIYGGAVLVLALLAAVVWFFWLAPDEPPVAEPVAVPETVPAPEPEPAPEPMPEEREPAPEPEVVTPEPDPLPRLNESDEFVREALTDLSEDERLQSWLEHEELVRRFAVVLDNAEQGEIPRRQLGFLAPQGAFPVIRDGDDIRLDERGYRRYDPFVNTVTRLSPAQSATLIRRLEPLLVQALEELGVEEASPRESIAEAIALAKETPVIESPIMLEQPSVLYEFADESLEALTPLQKQLLRMGPDNLRRLQSYLAEVEEHL